MSYGNSSFEEGKILFERGKTDINAGRPSGRLKLQEAAQIFMNCVGQHPEAQDFLNKTNKLLSRSA